MINAAIVGLGRWGRRLVDSTQSHGIPLGTEIHFTRAVVRTASNAQDYAAAQQLDLSTSLDEVCADGRIDAVVLATPHDCHVQQILTVIARKKHVFVEKPLALCVSDAEAVMTSAREAKVIVGVGYNRRFLPAAYKIKQLQLSRRFGQIIHMQGNFSNNSGLNFRQGMWRAEERGAKAAMTAMGTHILDFFIYLCGPIYSVQTISARHTMSVDVDDVVCVNLVFKSGTTGTLTTMLATPRVWRIELFGTSMWAHMRDEHLVDFCDETGLVEEIRFENVDSLKLELDSFAGAIRGASAYSVSMPEVLHGVAALEAVLESATAGGSPIVVKETCCDFADAL
jgi:predicted dehydrogenase